jgi:hypothetical protein
MSFHFISCHGKHNKSGEIKEKKEHQSGGNQNDKESEIEKILITPQNI